jgi:hypothetical protein
MPWNPLPLMDVKGVKIGELVFQVNVLMSVGNHEEKIMLDVVPISNHSLILGLPWLQAHNPTIDWSTGHIQFSLQHCNEHCLPQVHDTLVQQESAPLHPTKQPDPSPEPMNTATLEPDLVDIYVIDLMPTATEEQLKNFIPSKYHDFLDVFDPEGPMHELPPLRPGYDFEIPLDPNKPLPKPAHPYHMSLAEHKDWVKWQDTMLAAGLISKALASTPVAAPFFFMWKKDRTRCDVCSLKASLSQGKWG